MKTRERKNRIKGILDTIIKVLLVLFLVLLLISILKVLLDCRYIRPHTTIVDQTGYLPDEEDWEIIPDTIAPYDDNDLDSLPKSVSLEKYFPPIGNQGSYGTCVAWAAGYNLNTALNAIKNHWTPDQLKDPSNQTSPKDLWMGISSGQKGQFCTGTNFEPTFSVLINDGVASMKEVPYRNLGSCNGQFVGDQSNKLALYRHVISASGAGPSVKQMKAYLNDTIPLVIAAHLGDQFMTWNNADVIRTDTYLSPDAEHAFHAMALTGYDDDKNAFRVRNSWGKDWGDNGSIWVDYDFFMNSFCTEVFMAKK